jgi:hypothetical protein
VFYLLLLGVMKSFVERVRENNAKGEKTMVDVFA